jgi:hypothetical protein
MSDSFNRTLRFELIGENFIALPLVPTASLKRGITLSLNPIFNDYYAGRAAIGGGGQNPLLFLRSLTLSAKPKPKIKTHLQ